MSGVSRPRELEELAGGSLPDFIPSFAQVFDPLAFVFRTEQVGTRFQQGTAGLEPRDRTAGSNRNVAVWPCLGAASRPTMPRLATRTGSLLPTRHQLFPIGERPGGGRRAFFLFLPVTWLTAARLETSPCTTYSYG
jgi:hypothetical protein